MLYLPNNLFAPQWVPASVERKWIYQKQEIQSFGFPTFTLTVVSRSVLLWPLAFSQRTVQYWISIMMVQTDIFLLHCANILQGNIYIFRRSLLNIMNSSGFPRTKITGRPLLQCSLFSGTIVIVFVWINESLFDFIVRKLCQKMYTHSRLCACICIRALRQSVPYICMRRGTLCSECCETTFSSELFLRQCGGTARKRKRCHCGASVDGMKVRK